MKPRHLFLFCAGTLLTTSLVALCPDPADHGDKPMPVPQKQMQPKPMTCPKPKSPCEPKPPEPECPRMDVFPEAGPLVCDGADVYFTGTFILWTPRQDGLEYAISGVGNNVGKGDVHSIDFGVEPGFKVGLGWDLPHDDWDLYAQFTWLHADGDGKTTKANTAGIVNPQFDPIISNKANWNLKFNVIDLELGRNFFVSKYLKLRPFGGFKGTWQDQDYSVNYVTDNIIRNDAKTTIDQDFWGFGIRGGCNTAWHFTNSWSVFGNCAISALWSGYDVDRKDVDTFLGIDDTTLNTQNNYHTISPVLELILGIRYDLWFYYDEYHLSIDAGWEEQVWWGHNRYVVINQPQQNGGNLSFQGLTLTVRFDF
ncbi:MAG TPA: Lpg1974 family pore-forming outer membrane protein [Chlamydiales bacterium]|nr:Lpg1974 family pore-forming outer membrane protein [Chlamydiales bacterium]